MAFQRGLRWLMAMAVTGACLWAGPVEGDAPAVETQETLYQQMTGAPSASAPAMPVAGIADGTSATQGIRDKDLLLAGLDGKLPSSEAGKTAVVNPTGGAGAPSRSERAGWLLLGLVATGFLLAAMALALGRRGHSS